MMRNSYLHGKGLGCLRHLLPLQLYHLSRIPALKHDLVPHEAQAPTCTEIGWDAYETCSRCDYTTYQEIPALNHDLVHHEAKAPTCTEKGWNAYETCSRCDYTTYAELSALNHDYQAVTVEPTCETDGYTVFTCSRCKDSYTADPTDKLGHQFGAWSPNGTGSQSAGCLRQGCAHIGSTDCRKFTFRTAEGETLTFCPVCGRQKTPRSWKRSKPQRRGLSAAVFLRRM